MGCRWKCETTTFLDPDPGEICPFDTLITTTANQLICTELPNGVPVITGPAIATVTNQETNKSLIYNISGPGKCDP